MTTMQDIIDRFPAFAALGGIPEVQQLIAGLPLGATSSYLQEQLWQSDWWRHTPESSRTWQARKLIDPATAGQQAHTMAANVIGIATTLGIHLSPGEVAWYSELAASNGWDQIALTRSLVDNTQRARFQAGTIGSTRDSLKATAANYGVNISETNAFHWAQQIATGRQTQEGFEDWSRNQAKAAYPMLTKEIDAGLTVRQIADPYLQIAGQLLDKNPDTMSLSDPRWQRALQGRDETGKATGPMNTQDWARHLMTDPQYQYEKSRNGQSAALQLRDALGKTFGVST